MTPYTQAGRQIPAERTGTMLKRYEELTEAQKEAAREVFPNDYDNPKYVYKTAGITIAFRASDVTEKCSNLAGKLLRSKINGKLFYVEGLFAEKAHNGKDRYYYKICEPGTDKYTAIGKEWFERGMMQNIEILE